MVNIGWYKKNPNPLVGKPVPYSSIEFIDLGDEVVRLNDLLKMPGYKLINFWASWCLPCDVEHPYLMALKGKNNLIMIGVNYKDAGDQCLNFIY